MINRNNILSLIKERIKAVEPDATVILYGSVARKEDHEGSDIDLLILLNVPSISIEKRRTITYPLYDLEFETGQLISPLVISKTDWETRHRITPFYANVLKEGIVI